MRTRKTNSGESCKPSGPTARCPWGPTAIKSVATGCSRAASACGTCTGAAEREGSLDSAIRDAVVNDIAGLRLPALAAIAHNGGESFRHARHTRTLGVPVHRLPSSSPANASWSFERKVAAWREVFAQYLPVP